MVVGPVDAGLAAAGGVDHDPVARVVEAVDEGDARGGMRLGLRVVVVAGTRVAMHAVEVEGEGAARPGRSPAGEALLGRGQIGPVVDVVERRSMT